ncbi:tetratricopeptide repeat protein [Candidatus Poribacteria bacterium]|nr:tetratricopeptide repeat protein [Candidatus Poribacteria bacterium]
MMNEDSTSELTLWKRAIEINPNNANAHNNLGNAYEAQGQYEQAIAAYQRAIDIDPNDAIAHINLGVVYTKQGQYEQAIAAYKKGIDINPSDAIACYNIAGVYSLQNEKTLSMEFLQRALALDKSLLEFAKTDTDFANIRNTPEFQQIINSQ